MALKDIDRKIKQICTNAAKLNGLIHETGVLILEHAKEHGDCTRALVLVTAMPASMRRTMLVAWLNTYSPIRVILANDKCGMLKADAKGFTPFDIDAAREHPFWVMAEEKPEKEYDFDALVALAERLPKLIDKKISDGKVPVVDQPSARAMVDRLKALKFERVIEAIRIDNDDAAPALKAVNG